MYIFIIIKTYPFGNRASFTAAAFFSSVMDFLNSNCFATKPRSETSLYFNDVYIIIVINFTWKHTGKIQREDSNPVLLYSGDFVQWSQNKNVDVQEKYIFTCHRHSLWSQGLYLKLYNSNPNILQYTSLSILWYNTIIQQFRLFFNGDGGVEKPVIVKGLNPRLWFCTKRATEQHKCL